MKHIQMIHYEPNTPMIVWCTHRSLQNGSADISGISEQEANHMTECIEAVGISHYSLCAYPADDWNADYSPWPSLHPMDSSAFAGNGSRTKEIIYSEIMEMQRDLQVSEWILTGYSLAGLFVLWAGLSCDIINGIICCSGSLWYEGFTDYLEGLEVKHEKCVYLSLGGKEKRTANPVMRTIEDKTRETADILKRKTGIRKVCFSLKSGGHFADGCKRIANGIEWMMNKQQILQK